MVIIRPDHLIISLLSFIHDLMTCFFVFLLERVRGDDLMSQPWSVTADLIWAVSRCNWCESTCVSLCETGRAKWIVHSAKRETCVSPEVPKSTSIRHLVLLKLPSVDYISNRVWIMWRHAWKREVYVLHSLTRKPTGIYNSIKKMGCLILCAVCLHLCVYCCSKRGFTSNTPPQLRRMNHPVSHSVNVTSFTTHTSAEHHSHSDWDRHPDCTFAHVQQ